MASPFSPGKENELMLGSFFGLSDRRFGDRTLLLEGHTEPFPGGLPDGSR